MEITPAVRRLVHVGAPTHELREKHRETGGLTLREEGVLLAVAGKTSLEEIMRVTHNEDNDVRPATPRPEIVGAAVQKEAA
jgi:type II secretory ATPase GspE/PulE/Tfp pilus assembly ATPase PilB-like protein